MKAALEKAVADTARVVEEWASNIKKIEAQLANANSRLEKSEAHRKKFALDASLGNADAISQITKDRADSASAAGDIEDLGNALVDAKPRLIEAEAEAKKARQNMTKFKAQALQRKRVEAAAKIDATIADFALAFAEYEKLGQEIVSLPDQLQSNLHGMIDFQGPAGMRRVAAAMPAFFLKFYPGAQRDEQTKPMPLARAEEIYWGLAPIDSETKAA